MLGGNSKKGLEKLIHNCIFGSLVYYNELSTGLYKSPKTADLN